MGACEMARSQMLMGFQTSDEAQDSHIKPSVAAPARPKVYDWQARDTDQIGTYRGGRPQLLSVKAEDHATVLVVDDEISIAQLLEELLGSVGYRVLVAHSGHSGLELARSERPALILTDCMMPGLDGAEFVRRLRSSPVTNTIPVIMMSSIRLRPASREDSSRLPSPEARVLRTYPTDIYLASLGDVCLPFIEKPFDVDILLSIIETATEVPARQG